MATQNHYDEDFKRTLVDLYHSGKTQTSLCKGECKMKCVSYR